ncbi:hypothetical protein IFM89_019365 [Coptis chinensis]|uniref:DNA helicase n=1 Tax=Coptis chinensis TaxID=261450 RepID=A0A835MIN9_9MAGN|nr:hypothetical protein IFM89_019365 [Coptis chinensis]
MAPRKKSTSTSSQQPISKFGIPHLFQRHTQNLANSQNNPSPPISAPPILTTTTSTAGVVNDDSLALEVSPEISKSVKRFKFSPGMLIKQSQDEGGDEVTWKISPVNERLQAVSKRLPDVVRCLADASKHNASNFLNSSSREASFRQCFYALSIVQSSPALAGKLEKWLSSPTLKLSDKSLVSSGKLLLRAVKNDQDMELHGSRNDPRNMDTTNHQSPFRTPPSASYCSEPTNVNACKGASDQLGARQHRKALLELLDQVEDVITVEESVPNNSEEHFKTKEKSRGDVAVNIRSVVDAPQRDDTGLSDLNFLVLEVSEKHRAVESSCAQSPFKVLELRRKLLPNVSRFYSTIGPGDTINVIGEFDGQRKCVVDHESNLVIVHPDILVSGTRVAASFGCPRRSVLDERLKCNEHSTAALIGTLLHQIFQAGLLREHPTKDYLEEYAKIVLHKNIESMYACGVNETDMRTILLEAIPKMINWITRFRNSQESQVPTVGFGSNNEEKYVHIDEVMDIEEMAWAPRYGLKGEIDASVRVKVGSNISDTSEKFLPLEFKTGKRTTGQSFLEHSAQVILYTLLMSERYLKHIDSGLLYYLHTDQTQGIMAQRSDMVGIIMRRNELAHDILKASTVQQLPPMLQSLNVCKSCRYLNVCTVYHKVGKGLLHVAAEFVFMSESVMSLSVVSILGRFGRLELFCALVRIGLGELIVHCTSSLFTLCKSLIAYRYEILHSSFCGFGKAHGGNVDSSGLGDVFDSHVKHLSGDHCNFLRQWDHLIDLEAEQTQAAKRKLWHSHNQSECSPSGISSVKLDLSNDLSPNKSSEDGRFIYRFARQDVPLHDIEMDDGEVENKASSLTRNLDCTLKCGDYVILRTESGNFVVANGIINEISRLHVLVSLSKRLRLPRSSPRSETVNLLREIWQIDKDEAITSYATMRFNLVQLFVQSAQASHLRKMIVDLEAPRYDSGLILSQDPAIAYIRSEKNLNNDQRRAIHKILTAKDYALILGMPGTGKTSTMVHAVKALLMRGSSILLTSYTNSAVDNLLIKLKSQSIDFVRIGRYEVVHEEVRGHCLSATGACSVEDINLRLDQVKVVAVTCLGITHPLLSKKKFDMCIMDEAGQTTLPVSLGPLMFASTFVLVGDHYQLPPLVQSTEARENGMGISLFCRLSEAHPQAISALRSQYRMCAGIMELSNALIYGNRLHCGSSEIASAKLKFLSTLYSTSWLKEVLDPNRSVVFVNTDMLSALEVRDNKTVNNPTEAYIVAEISKELVDKGIIEEEIGIITPYNSQANTMKRVVGTAIEIHTIDKYQGRDKDCILVSFVRSSENQKSYSSSLLGDWHRINVALTRAKKKLIMVGSCRTLSRVPLLKLLIDKVGEQSGILTFTKKDVYHLGALKRCSHINLSVN